MPEVTSVRWRRWMTVLSPAAARTRGEWATDAALFALAVAMMLLSVLPGANPQVPAWLWPWDITLGTLAALSIWWSRRHPMLIGLLMVVPGAIALTSVVGVLVSVHRMGLLARVVPAAVATVLHIVTAIPYHAILPLPGMPWEVWIVWIPLMYALCLCLGLLGRARRQLIINLRESAQRDRERYEERLASTRRDERVQIAREMHDVLAHRISLLSMHAGALEFRAESPRPPAADELRSSARIIRENAEGAVEDLRELLGLLRSDGELSTAAPQPRLADIDRLLQDAASAGQRVTFESDVRADRLRETTQRTAYRVVQEALTNARKHAPHAPVTVRLSQDRTMLTITATNPLPPGITRWDLESDGSGLIGLEERVGIDGGLLRAGVESGHFRLRAELPVGTR